MDFLSLLLVVLGALLLWAGLRRRKDPRERSGTRLLTLGAVLCLGVLGVWVSGMRTGQFTLAAKDPNDLGKGGHLVDREGRRYFRRDEWAFWGMREGGTFTCVMTELPFSETPHLLRCSGRGR